MHLCKCIDISGKFVSFINIEERKKERKKTSPLNNIHKRKKCVIICMRLFVRMWVCSRVIVCEISYRRPERWADSDLSVAFLRPFILTQDCVFDLHFTSTPKNKTSSRKSSWFHEIWIRNYFFFFCRLKVICRTYVFISLFSCTYILACCVSCTYLNFVLCIVWFVEFLNICIKLIQFV